MYNKTISSKKLISRIVNELGLANPKELEADIFAYVDDAIDTMDLSNYYTPKLKPVEVKDNIFKLPCDIKYLHSIYINSSGCSGCGGNNWGVAKLNLRNNPLIGSLISGIGFHDGQYGTVVGNSIKTTFNKGNALIVYYSVPKDENGYPMIPDNAIFKEAFQYYVIYRLGFRGFNHSIIDFRTALTKWEQLYPRAMADINWFDRGDYEEFTDIWTNLRIGDLKNNLYFA